MLLRLMSCSAARSPAPQVTYAALCLARWSDLAALTGPEGVWQMATPAVQWADGARGCPSTAPAPCICGARSCFGARERRWRPAIDADSVTPNGAWPPANGGAGVWTGPSIGTPSNAAHCRSGALRSCSARIRDKQTRPRAAGSRGAAPHLPPSPG